MDCPNRRIKDWDFKINWCPNFLLLLFNVSNPISLAPLHFSFIMCKMRPLGLIDIEVIGEFQIQRS